MENLYENWNKFNLENESERKKDRINKIYRKAEITLEGYNSKSKTIRKSANIIFQEYLSTLSMKELVDLMDYTLKITERKLDK